MSGSNCKKAKNNLDVTTKRFCIGKPTTDHQNAQKMNWFPSEIDEKYFAKALTQHL